MCIVHFALAHPVLDCLEVHAGVLFVSGYNHFLVSCVPLKYRGRKVRVAHVHLAQQVDTVHLMTEHVLVAVYVKVRVVLWPHGLANIVL